MGDMGLRVIHCKEGTLKFTEKEAAFPRKVYAKGKERPHKLESVQAKKSDFSKFAYAFL